MEGLGKAMWHAFIMMAVLAALAGLLGGWGIGCWSNDDGDDACAWHCESVGADQGAWTDGACKCLWSAPGKGGGE